MSDTSFSLSHSLIVRTIDRKRVLTHHPDKQTTDEQKEGGDNFFKCIKIGLFVYRILSS